MFRKTLFVVLAIGFVTSLVLQAQGGIEIKKGEVYVSGENPGIRLLMKEGADPSTEVSFWRVIYSPAGIGHVCYVTSDITGDGPSSDDVRVALTDNDALADYLSKDIMSVFNKVYVENPFPKSRATFQKSGDTRKEWKETIKSDKYTVELLWRDFYTPFLIDVTGGRPVPVRHHVDVHPRQERRCRHQRQEGRRHSVSRADGCDAKQLRVSGVLGDLGEIIRRPPRGCAEGQRQVRYDGSRRSRVVRNPGTAARLASNSPPSGSVQPTAVIALECLRRYCQVVARHPISTPKML